MTAKWTIRRISRPDAALRLFVVPHSGGSPGEYVRWADQLPEMDVAGIQLPGRGGRLSEQPLTSMDEVVTAVIENVHFAAPFILVGHSLGGLVAYEVALALRDRKLP